MKVQIDLGTTGIFYDAQTGQMEFKPAPQWICWNDGPRPHGNLKIKDWQSKDYLRLYDFGSYDINRVTHYNSDYDYSTRFNYHTL